MTEKDSKQEQGEMEKTEQEKMDKEAVDTKTESAQLDASSKGFFNRFNGSTIVLSVIIVVLLAFTIFQTISSNDENEIVASVNGENITKEQLYDSMVEQSGKQMLDQLITNKLIAQKAAEENIQVKEEDINTKLQEIKDSLPSEDQFSMLLQQYGMTEDQLKDQLMTQVLIEKIFEPEIEVTEDEMKTFFEKNKQQFPKDATFADNKEMIQKQLFNSKLQQKAQQWLQETKEKADITNKLVKA